ncbi:putative bifunctional diguanylate cyclase/phosphodiesterase [Chelativorans sp. M5D2P16]|uniref:putative bifunctional diguanylate cyclase/phosphodiesterase n=1 Tax=Chelativorans sp. M5D2P16 TaxID=3095678 RepID=UPI002ACAF716|nr:EAL domain-containing protein [Chelativorans sp. M5D2P16]MDZ5695796.1 EAL domain-containing protein [Chelativorans sp. M5D2P16]
MKTSKSDISEAVYVGYIRSLFQDVGVLPLGAACFALVSLLLYHKTGALVYLIFAGLLLFAGTFRYYLINRIDPQQISDYESALHWERRYVLWGTLHGLVVGSFGLVAMVWGDNSFSELAALSLVLGGTITVAGRNYGSRKMVTILTLALVAPLALGLMLKGDIYHFALGLFIVPFIFIIMKMADLVRTVLFTAISEEKRSASLARRFNRALNTMPHGLLMFSPEGRIVVANAQVVELMSFRSTKQMLGRSLKALLSRGVAAGLMERKDVQFAEQQLTRAMREGRDRKVLLRLTDGRHLEFSAREGRDELGVLTFEEVTSRVEAEERVRYMARYDSLTGLPNRAYFNEIVTEFMESSDPARLCGLAVLDLDDFKSINDTLGHPVGDGLIYAVADRLSSFAGDDVKVSRFGGDEFMIFFNRLEGEDDLVLRLDAIFEKLRGDVDVAGHQLRVQLSAGAVLVRADSDDVGAMIVKADLALYTAKEQGKNSWRLFETQMDAAFRSRQTLKADLRSAIEAQSLRVVFQPIIDVRTMQISGCEALCRWDHPELGPISPAEFIPLAEEMGIVSEISTMVLNVACRECVRWPEHLRVSVNLSARDFHCSSVVDKVQQILSKSGLAADRLELEVTETALLDDKATTRVYLEELKKLGVTIALDDFGTGYSSLSYLHTLPLDKIKIDGSFLVDVTRSERSLRLLTGVVDLSRNLGLSVTVEGVETFSQLKILTKKVHPDLVQGFLFGSALTASGIETMSDKSWTFGGNTRTALNPASA